MTKILIDKETVKWALEASRNLLCWDNGQPEYVEAQRALKALRQALKESSDSVLREQSTEQEPVAWTIDSLEQEIYEKTRQFVSLDVMELLLNLLNTSPSQPQEAVLVEREACAKVLDEMADDMAREMEPSTAIAYVRSKAAAIRARGNT